ncbi:hypothetical protein [Oryzifoliimicrobium ureilyticus]|uniref:hypothetical protein n=1 Tax=Oryzifoliimicrobium ureilyticus TaxID=3113724 RepID=UPI0030767C70
MSPLHVVVANDNADDLAAPEGDPDMRHEVRPTEGELMKAASGGLRCSVLSSKVKGQWTVMARRQPVFGVTYVDGVYDGYRIGDLLFRNGKLLSIGVTAKGMRKMPAERTRQPRGHKAPPPRSQDSIRFLLPANDNTPIAKGAGWLGGITRSKGNATRPDLGEHEAALEIDRARKQRAIRLSLGLDAAVLDAAITDATAKQIGEAFGYSGKTAERRGIEKINAALKRFQEIAA